MQSFLSAGKTLTRALLVCGVLAGATPVAMAADYVIKVSHAVTVKHPGHKAMETFKEKVEAESDGRIEVRIFHSSQLAGQREGVEGLQSGTIEITLTPNGIAASFDKTFALLDIPFQFADSEHARRAIDDKGEQLLFANLSKAGLVGLALWEQGMRNLGTAQAPATTASQMSGLKLRTMEAPLHITAWKSLGANPTPIGWAQVYTALQQGVIDGVENPSYIFSQTPVHEQLNYLALTEHIYDPILVLGSKAFFDRLPDDLRALVMRTLKDLTDQQRELVDQDVKQAETVDLPAVGVEVVPVDAQAKAELARLSQPQVLAEVESRVGADLLKEWQTVVESARQP